MLLIQNISLTWHKNERGAQGEEARRRFALAYPLDETRLSGLNETRLSGEVIVHNLNFYQKGTTFIETIEEERRSLQKYLPQFGFTQNQIQNEIQRRIIGIKRYEYQSYPLISSLNLANVSICCKGEGLEIMFFYDEHRSGAPWRRGHNKDFCNPDSPFCGKDMLNEMAFVLQKNQYGRISWNERRTDYDTGEWYYQLHIYNLFYLYNQCEHYRRYLDEKNISKNIFTKNKPDFEYKQFAFLY